jgi:hypothetical protein
MKRIDEAQKPCAHCRSVMERKRYPGGRLECLQVFIDRLYCDRLCFRESMKRKGKSWKA